MVVYLGGENRQTRLNALISSSWTEKACQQTPSSANWSLYSDRRSKYDVYGDENPAWRRFAKHSIAQTVTTNSTADTYWHTVFKYIECSLVEPNLNTISTSENRRAVKSC